MPGAFRRQDLGNLARTRFNGFLLPNSSTVSQTKTEKSEKAGPFYTGPHASFCLGIVPPGSLIFGFLSELRGFRQRLEIMLSPHLGVASDDACSCPLWIRAVQSRRTIRPHVFQYVSPPVIYGVMLSRLRHSGS